MAINKSKITKHLSKDPVMHSLVETIPFPTITTNDSPLSHSLIESIVYQQLSIKAAATIFGRLLDLFKDNTIDLQKLSKLDTEKLRAVGLSYQKADYVRNIAQFFLAKENQQVDWNNLTDDELLKKLTVIKGVGTWTVQMIMISPMGKLDVFPVLDLGVQQGIKGLYEDVPIAGKPMLHRMHEIAEAWRPYRSVACHYLWRWKDQWRK